MCGRYTIVTPTSELARYFGLIPPSEAFKHTDDARPTNDLPIVLENEPNQMVIGHWGFPMKIAGKEKELINVRAESIIEKPYFRKIAEKHRCIILVDGFYEWKRDGKQSQKYKFTLEHGPMAFAGIYEWKTKKLSDEIRPFFSIITTTPNSVVARVHDRMPVILPAGKEKLWIEAAFSTDLLASFTGKLNAERVP
jgi:putative SOS response-associated peptidase YedK